MFVANINKKVFLCKRHNACGATCLCHRVGSGGVTPVLAVGWRHPALASVPFSPKSYMRLETGIPPQKGPGTKDQVPLFYSKRLCGRCSWGMALYGTVQLSSLYEVRHPSPQKAGLGLETGVPLGRNLGPESRVCPPKEQKN